MARDFWIFGEMLALELQILGDFRISRPSLSLVVLRKRLYTSYRPPLTAFPKISALQASFTTVLGTLTVSSFRFQGLGRISVSIAGAPPN